MKVSKHEVSKPYFPGFTRKSVTFSIDDGNLVLDRKFISIVAPYGIKGTFNLCGNNMTAENREEVIALYRGFEVSNHCAYHPYCLEEEMRERIVEEPFVEENADPDKIYPYAEIPGLYHIHPPKGWRNAAFIDDYLRFAEEGQRTLENVFGVGNIQGFEWPFGKQKSVECYERLIAMGFVYIRIGGNVLDTTGYAIPEDWYNWTFNATGFAIRGQVETYANYPDDGELKFFCIGAHSIDFLHNNNFSDLEFFAQTFGNKPDLYYCAGIYDIFTYCNATKALVITDNFIENPSDRDIYIKVDGEKFIVRSHTKLDLETKTLVFLNI